MATPIFYEEFSQLLKKSPSRKTIYNRSDKIKKLPPQLRLQIKQEKLSHLHLYDPMAVSYGPYHHGEPELSASEDFKYMFLDRITSGEEAKHLLYSKVLERIHEIRGCYADTVCVNMYDDQALATMILLDGCFIVAFIECLAQELDKDTFSEWQFCLGATTLRSAIRDMMLLENQIPFFVIKLLLDLMHETEEKKEKMIKEFLNWMLPGESKGDVPAAYRDEVPPVHLLEACHRMLVGKKTDAREIKINIMNINNNTTITETTTPPPPPTTTLIINTTTTNTNTNDRAEETPMISERNRRIQELENQLLNGRAYWKSPAGRAYDRKNPHSSITSSCRSVMDLKAKGIRVRRSSSSFYKDVKFTSGAFYGELQLPGHTVSSNTQVILSNMIAYEVSSGARTEFEVLSFVNFMKSLIQSPDDVVELQEKGIIFNRFHNHEQVVQVFRDIDTFGIDNVDMFGHLKWEIEEHCRSKAKTWLADLIHTRFSSPWTAIALLAAIFLLCLTFLQTYFTIHPQSSSRG